MKLARYTRKDWIIIGVLLPPVIILLNYWIFDTRYFNDPAVFIVASIVSGVLGLASWHMQILVAIWLSKKYPSYKQTLKRLFIAVSLYILITSITIYVVFTGYCHVGLFDYQINYTHLTWSILTGILVDILAASFHEAVAFYERWKRAVVEAEELKRENLQSQLDSLKAQVNPHFLFNSLNSLSSLIGEDSVKAEKFLDELSKVYRYLLRNNEDDLTSLFHEMQFIQSYYHLLKTRYGDSLLLDTYIETKYLDYQIPPLTLQMLVENAVKHNMMMKEMPLKIEIRTKNDKLFVSNNLQRKVRKVSSNRIGLGNIAKKYKLLKQEEIMVNEDNGVFEVVIPLIKEPVFQ